MFRRYLLLNGIHNGSKIVAGKKTAHVYQAGDANNNIVIHRLNLVALHPNKFQDMGPCQEDGTPIAGPAGGGGSQSASSVPSGNNVTTKFIGAAEKNLAVFDVNTAIKDGGGHFVYEFDGTSYNLLNPAGKGLSVGKATDLVNAYGE